MIAQSWRRDIVWLGLAGSVSGLVTLVGVRLITEQLPPSAYAELALVLAAQALVSVLTVGPLAQIVGRAAAGLTSPWIDISGSPLARTYFLLTVAGTATLIVAAGIAHGLGYGGSALFVCAVLHFFECTRAFYSVMFSAVHWQRRLAIWQMLDVTCRLSGAVIVLCFISATPAGAISGQLAGMVLSATVVYMISRRDLGHMQVLSADVAARHAAPLIPQGALSWANSVGDRYVVASIAGMDVAGVYSAGQGLVSKPMQMSMALVIQVFRPRLYAALASSNREQVRRWIKNMLVAFWTFAACLGIPFVFLPNAVVRALLANEYASAASILSIVWVSQLFSSTAHCLYTLQIGELSTANVLRAEVLGTIAGVFGMMFLTPRFGVIGASLGVLLGSLAQVSAAIASTRRSMLRTTRGQA